MVFNKRKVKAQIKKAFMVIERTTSKPGPKQYGNNWPYMVREPLDKEDRIPDDDESYRTLLKISVQPSTVTWAKAVVDAINDLQEQERKLVYSYFGERMRNRTDEEISKKVGISRQTLDRQLSPILQKLAEAECLKRLLRHSDGVDDVIQNPVNPRVLSELRQREKTGQIQAWMEPEARGSMESFGSEASE